MKFSTIKYNNLRVCCFDEDPEYAFVHKVDSLQLLGLNKDNIRDWKTYFEIYELAKKEIMQVNTDSKFQLGYSTEEYKNIQSKILKNLPKQESTIPEEMYEYMGMGYEYINEQVINYMKLFCNTDECKRYRFATARFRPSSYITYKTVFIKETGKYENVVELK